MAKEFAASKTQMAKAADLGIDTSDRPGYTTLGAALEAAGWSKDGKTQMSANDVPLATIALDMKAAHKSDYELRQERKARGPWWQQPQRQVAEEYGQDFRPALYNPIEDE